ncbi:hypothetical protein [Bacillus subtilis]|uniref:hypothetical protein n=1 Tax=Bacillus subtilis TaxID=1423 RepID=UPI003F868E6E
MVDLKKIKYLISERNEAMSATNRGAKRIESDFYPTPVKTIENFLNNYELHEGTILEPCAGNGNFIKVLRKLGYKNKIVANEIRVEENDNLLYSGADYIYNVDFLNERMPEHNITTIITNPPFNLAREFVTRCKELYPEAEIIMLLRTAFLESRVRYDFWQNNKVNKLYTLSSRPKFVNGKTDATSYSFFIWNNTKDQEIKVI